MKQRVAVCCSGGGSNFKAIYYSIAVRRLPIEVVLCISNKKECGAMAFAKDNGIPQVVLSSKVQSYADDFLAALSKSKVDIVLLAGYLKKVPPKVVAAYRNKILNIHPSLLPKFGGAGMYGLHVHEAVISAKEKETGATVHIVNEEFDKGEMLLQAATFVKESDTPEELASRVLLLEHQLYPAALEVFLKKVSKKD